MPKKRLFTDAQKKELDQINRIEFEIQDTLHRVQMRFATLAKELFDVPAEDTVDVLVRAGIDTADDAIAIRRTAVENCAYSFDTIRAAINKAGEYIEQVETEMKQAKETADGRRFAKEPPTVGR